DEEEQSPRPGPMRAHRRWWVLTPAFPRHHGFSLVCSRMHHSAVRRTARLRGERRLGPGRSQRHSSRNPGAGTGAGGEGRRCRFAARGDRGSARRVVRAGDPPRRDGPRQGGGRRLAQRHVKLKMSPVVADDRLQVLILGQGLEPEVFNTSIGRPSAASLMRSRSSLKPRMPERTACSSSRSCSYREWVLAYASATSSRTWSNMASSWYCDTP